MKIIIILIIAAILYCGLDAVKHSNVAQTIRNHNQEVENVY